MKPIHKTLALNMIVGANDGDLLNRLLSSFDCRGFYDEIVIVCTTKDQRVNEIAHCFTDKVFTRSWTSERYPHGDFAGARQQALDNTTTDYVMWLDSDDMLECKVLDGNLSKALENTRTFLDRFSFDCYLMKYVTERDVNGAEIMALFRERIWKRSTMAKWEHPCHEQLTLMNHHKILPLAGINIDHQPVKTMGAGMTRNLKILEHEYRNHRTRHSAYYFARDLIVAGRQEEAVPILCEIVDKYNGDNTYIYEACMDLAKIYLYDKMQAGNISRVKYETADIAEQYLRVAVEVSNRNAEPYVYIGDMWQANGLIDEAVTAYKTAMGKDYGQGTIQQAAYYEPLPASRLSKIYHDKGEIEQAIWYNHLALSHFKNDVSLIGDRRKYANEFLDVVKQEAMAA